MTKCLHSRRQMYRQIRLHNIPCQPHAASLFFAGETLRIRVQSLAMCITSERMLQLVYVIGNSFPEDIYRLR